MCDVKGRIFGFQVTQRKDGVEEDVVNVLSESEDVSSIDS